MGADILDGRRLAEKLKAGLAAKVREAGAAPGLAFISVAGDAASRHYALGIKKACDETGFAFHNETVAADISPADFLAVIQSYNARRDIHGILIQSPLPQRLEDADAANTIAPSKDVDGIHPVNQGLVFSGKGGFAPCTARGVLALLEQSGIAPEGKRVVILGRGAQVGRPLAFLLLAKNATVTVCHTKTRDLPSIARQAEILVACVGSPQFVKKEFVAEGAVVVDVGIHDTGGGAPIGDVDFRAVSQVASYISPVPGGVGPMTVAALLENTFDAFAKSGGVKKESGRADTMKREVDQISMEGIMGSKQKQKKAEEQAGGLDMSVEDKGLERRRFRRVDHHLEVRYYIAANSEPVKVYTEDISAGGIRIHNPFPIDEQYQFPIRIMLDPKHNLEVKAIARVAWSRKRADAQVWEMGIEFIQMQDADRDAVERYVEEAS